VPTLRQTLDSEGSVEPTNTITDIYLDVQETYQDNFGKAMEVGQSAPTSTNSLEKATGMHIREARLQGQGYGGKHNGRWLMLVFLPHMFHG
jgi:hypothetical protein